MVKRIPNREPAVVLTPDDLSVPVDVEDTGKLLEQAQRLVGSRKFDLEARMALETAIEQAGNDPQQAGPALVEAISAAIEAGQTPDQAASEPQPQQRYFSGPNAGQPATPGWVPPGPPPPPGRRAPRTRGSRT